MNSTEITLFETLATIDLIGRSDVIAIWVVDGPPDKIATNLCFVETLNSKVDNCYPMEPEDLTLFAIWPNLVSSWQAFIGEFKPWQFPDWDKWQYYYREATSLNSSGATMQAIKHKVIEKYPEFAQAQKAAWLAWHDKAYRAEWAYKQIDRFKITTIKRFEQGVEMFINGQPKPDGIAESAGWDYGKAASQLRAKSLGAVETELRRKALDLPSAVRPIDIDRY